MKIFAFLILMIGVVFYFFSCEKAVAPADAATLVKNVEWLESSSQFGSACIRICDEKVIYFDPSGLIIKEETPKADVIFITHSHSDHLSVGNVRQLVKDDTVIVTIPEIKAILEERLPEGNLHFQTIEAGEKVKIKGMEIEAVPAYNTAEQPAHPKESGWVGYLINYRGVHLYHSGDTSFITEMKDLKNIDIAFLTIRDIYMMSGQEAIQAINAFKPRYVIPIHWLKTEERDIEYLKANCPSTTELLLLTPKQP
jgi:L-ascorbate metabolism protein UlaG (beta-lactamase superfamily)